MMLVDFQSRVVSLVMRVLSPLAMMSLACLLFATGLSAAQSPVCPGGAEAPYPAFGKFEDAPNVSTWHNLASLADNCHISLNSPAVLGVALAGSFNHAGGVSDIAARLGAISETKGLVYWSVSDGDWRELVSDAAALSSAEAGAVRPDFTWQEILNGQELYFLQNDTRSWGENIYRFRAIESSPEHLVFVSNNVSPIKLGPVTLFKPGDASSVLFLNRLDDTTWSYYSLTVVKRSKMAAREKSLVNRQAAFYRLLIGQALDHEPPLAR